MKSTSGIKGQEPDHGKIDNFNSTQSQGSTKSKLFWGERKPGLIDPSDTNRHVVGTGMTPAYDPSPVSRMKVIKTSVGSHSTTVDSFVQGRTKSLALKRGDKYASR